MGKFPKNNPFRSKCDFKIANVYYFFILSVQKMLDELFDTHIRLIMLGADMQHLLHDEHVPGARVRTHRQSGLTQ